VSTAATAFAPEDPDFIRDPYPALAALREGPAVVYDEATDHWLVSRHEHVNATLRDRRFGRTYHHLATDAEMGRPPAPSWHEPFWTLIRGGLLDMEPPDHTRVRGLLTKAFTPRMVEGLREPISRITAKLADLAADLGEFDLLATYAEPLPVEIIAELLGVPEEDRHLLRPWSADICRMYELHPTEEDARIAVAASRSFTEYLRDLSRARREDPRDDLISAMTQVVLEGERLTEQELIGTCVLLLNAGHEATVNMTGNGWWSLFRNPDELARLRADHGLVPSAVEEILRYDTSAPIFERWVLEDSVIGGVEVPKGAELGLLFAAANRDPEVFPDPDRMDLTREPNPHLTFGAGIHFCLGAPLARIELQTSFRTLLERFPRMELVEEPSWKPGFVLRGLEGLRVRV
jgi:cytochrome P450